MAIHNRMRAMTIRQLGVNGNGAPAVLKRKSEGTFDPATGAVTGSTITEYNASAVRVNYKEYAYKNESIIYGDFQLYLCPVLQDGSDTPEPKHDDLITFSGDTFKVINIIPWNAAGVVCGWKLQMRKG